LAAIFEAIQVTNTLQQMFTVYRFSLPTLERVRAPMESEPVASMEPAY
jgi:hypothetical protein